MGRKIKKRIPIGCKGFNKKTLDDRVYSWLQVNSFAETYVLNNEEIKRTISPCEIAEEMKPWLTLYPRYSYKSARRKFFNEIKKFEKIGLIKKSEYQPKDKDIMLHIRQYSKFSDAFFDCYELVFDSKELYYLIDVSLLENLINNKRSGAIRIFSYLMFKYSHNDKYKFTIKELASVCYGVKYSSRNTKIELIIKEILEELQDDGFFKIYDTYNSLNGKATRVKQLKFIKKSVF